MAENGDDQSKVVEANNDVVTKLTGQLLSDPNVLAAFGKKLNSMMGQKSGYIDSLPKSVQRRIKALKKNQLDIFNIESQFYEEVHMLEGKYAKLYQPFFEKRSNIVNAITEPTDSECEWKSDEEDEDEKEEGTAVDGQPDKPNDPTDEIKKDDKKEHKFDENTQGIPEFWFTIMKSVPLCDSLIHEEDEEILKKLIDIRVVYSDTPDDMNFELHFEFAENDLFENKVLTKKYFMRCKPDVKFPMQYDGPEIVKSEGCKINWKNSTEEAERAAKRKEKEGEKDGPFVSFLDFFSPPEPLNEKDEMSEGERAVKESALVMDFEIGQLFQSNIIPKAVLYFTGEAQEEDGDEYDEDEDEYGEDEDDEDNDPDYKPAGGDKNVGECKQQ